MKTFTAKKAKQPTKAEISAVASAMGRKGSKKRVENMTPEERREQAIKASHSRAIMKEPRCTCGKFTVARAKIRKHVCSVYLRVPE